MKNLFFLLIFFWGTALQAQNLILNPNFEEGSMPTDQGEIHKATYWGHGCSFYRHHTGVLLPIESSDLYDEDIVDGGPMCGFDVPLNRFFLNRPGKIGNRYAGFISHASEFDTDISYGESIIGTLSDPLTADCSYVFKMHIANAERKKTFTLGGDTDCEGPYEPYVIDPNKTIDIVLRKDGICDEGTTVLTFTLDDNTSWTAYEGTFTLSADDLAEGYDRIEIRRGAVSDRINVVCDAVSLEADPSENLLNPSFTGDNEFCAGDPLTFVGNESSGTTDYTFWEIQETDAFGNPVSGGFNWHVWVPGAPGTFTFPEDIDPPCNTHFWIKMAASNACYPWEETVQIIKIHCNPKSPQGIRTVICEDECITLAEGVYQHPDNTYEWFVNGSQIINGGQLELTVCPDEYTVYTLVVTSTVTGCSSTSVFSIDLAGNDPTWSHYEDTSVSPYYFNIEAVANDLDTEDVEGFGYAWRIEKLDNELDPVCEVYNPSCWWTHPAPTKFDSYNGSCVASCGTSLPGRFYYNRYYRITRGTWTRNCPWRQQSKIIYATRGRSPESGPIVTVYEVEAPDMRDVMKPRTTETTPVLSSFDLFPNPNNGSEFFLHLEAMDTVDENIEISIANVEGKVVYTQKENIAPGQRTIAVNSTTKLSAGIYLVTMTSASGHHTQKMMVQ